MARLPARCLVAVARSALFSALALPTPAVPACGAAPAEGLRGAPSEGTRDARRPAEHGARLSPADWIEELLAGRGGRKRPRGGRSGRQAPKRAVEPRRAQGTFGFARDVAARLGLPWGAAEVRVPRGPGGSGRARGAGRRVALPARYRRPLGEPPAPDRLAEKGERLLRSARAEGEEGRAGWRKFFKEAGGWTLAAGGGLLRAAQRGLGGGTGPRGSSVVPMAVTPNATGALKTLALLQGAAEGVAGDLGRALRSAGAAAERPNAYRALTALFMAGVFASDVIPGGAGRQAAVKAARAENVAARAALRGLGDPALARALAHAQGGQAAVLARGSPELAQALGMRAWPGARAELIDAAVRDRLGAGAQAERVARRLKAGLPPVPESGSVNELARAQTALDRLTARAREPQVRIGGPGGGKSPARFDAAGFPRWTPAGREATSAAAAPLIRRAREQLSRGRSASQRSLPIANDVEKAYRRAVHGPADPAHADYRRWAEESRREGLSLETRADEMSLAQLDDFAPAAAQPAGLRPVRVPLEELPEFMAETRRPVLVPLRPGAADDAVVAGNPSLKPGPDGKGRVVFEVVEARGRKGVSYVDASALGQLASGDAIGLLPAR